MTGARSREALFADRILLVLALGAANAAHQRAQAGAAGAEIERMRTELDLETAPEGRAAHDAAREAEGAAQAALRVAESEVAALDARLAALDRALAAAPA